MYKALYKVIINCDGKQAVLLCLTMKEAEMVRQAYINWGGMGYDITIQGA